MKKYFVCLGFFFAIFTAMGQSQNLVLVGEYTNQDVFSGMDYSQGAHESKPYILKVFQNGILIADTDRNRVIRLDINFHVVSETMLKNTPATGDAFENYYYKGFFYFIPSLGDPYYENPSFVWDNSGNLGAQIRNFQTSESVDQIRESYRLYDRIFYSMLNGNILSYGINDLRSGGSISLLDNGQTRALFAPDSTWPHPGLVLDDKDRLILNGEIVTRDWKVFITWMLEKYGTIQRSGNASNWGNVGSSEYYWIKGVPFDPQSLLNISYEFQGRDAAGNWYWSGVVITPQGLIIRNGQIVDESFKPDYDATWFSSSVHPNGDIYYLIHKRGVISLSKIENTWSPEAKLAYEEGLKKGIYQMPQPPATAYRAPYGTVNDEGVRVRWNPNADARTGVNTSLKKGTSVQILARTETKVTIGGKSAYWYAVKTPEGVYGWSFGAFIDVVEPDMVMVGNGYFGPYYPPSER